LSDLAQQRTKPDTSNGTTAILLALAGLADEATGIERPYAGEAKRSLYAGLDTFRDRMVLSNHTGPVHSAVSSPDGRGVLTASWNMTARLWDGESGALLKTLEGHTAPVYSAVLSPDGRRVLTTQFDDETTRIWRTFPTTQAIVDFAKHVVARCLSYSELQQYYLPVEPPRWSITGAAMEREKAPAMWRPKYPYQTAAWRDWLAARDRGEAPPIPKE
jgi:WD40 repeat protein